MMPVVLPFVIGVTVVIACESAIISIRECAGFSPLWRPVVFLAVLPRVLWSAVEDVFFAVRGWVARMIAR